ncbi:dienelactone hydrolase family protein [Bradyrhizobium sp. CIAT3101]|uniref:dienelactone hydrolase family protein n=1 Tax=Bradyrhizobium sp. CIAT3101 TaxID=439387 RepID=UPI0024B182E0|nr:dienelactone hydrolase family protein [Bradyrhizobium sp. CIAT3101]WFU82313.1 dienelactone hydrolase family protein [Bradyrhizobium sp. CIAT3101]
MKRPDGFRYALPILRGLSEPACHGSQNVRSGVITRLILTILATFEIQTVASAGDLVKFDNAPVIMGQIQQQRARERGETPANTPDAIEGYLSRPEGPGPFPAVVYLHGCAGLLEKTRTRMAELFTGWSYVSLSVDSFTTRDIEHACDAQTVVRQGVLLARQRDALGALSYLAKLPYVDPKRIAVVGSSQGGIVSLQLASPRSVDYFAVPDGLKFRAAVAYYPLCALAADRLTIPAAILIGDLDDWSPTRDCELWMERRAGKGARVKLMIYPGAYHAFDAPDLNEGMRLFGHWLKYDANAASRSVQDMHDFLATELNE